MFKDILYEVVTMRDDPDYVITDKHYESLLLYLAQLIFVNFDPNDTDDIYTSVLPYEKLLKNSKQIDTILEILQSDSAHPELKESAKNISKMYNDIINKKASK